MASLFFLGKTILTVCLYVIILRLWMQRTRVNYYNPFTQFIVKITQPVIGPLRKIIPAMGRVDTASFVLLYIFGLIKVMFILAYGLNGPLFSPYYLLFAFVAIINAVGYLVFWLLLFRAILSWVSRGQSIADELLYQLTEPLVAPIRKIIPPFGMIDISFMIVVFVLVFLNMLAAETFGLFWVLL